MSSCIGGVGRMEIANDDLAIGFTDDLLINIFSRLPAKSLSRFRCVSKAWSSLMAEPYCRSKLPPAMAGFFLRSRIYQYYFPVSDYHSAAIDTSLSFIPSPKKPIVISSSNGLLCATIYHPTSSSSDIYVCNPATRSWTLIPNVARSIRDSLILAFDPEISPHFTLVLVKWRRVQIMWPITFEHESFEFETFSSRTNTWVKSQLVPRELGDGIQYPECHVYFNGNLHFLSYNSNCIVVIHLESMVCHRIQMPFRGASSMHGLLGMSCGSLHYAVRIKGEMQVWMLKDYEKHEWVMKSRVWFEFFNEFSWFDVVAFHPDADIVFLRVRVRGSEELVCYNWINGRLRPVCSLENNMSEPRLFVLSSYLGEDALEHKNCA